MDCLLLFYGNSPACCPAIDSGESGFALPGLLMIRKVTRGQDVGGLVRYVFGPGKENEHTDPRIVGAWDETLIGTTDPQSGRLARLIEQPLAALIDKPDRPVWHCSLRAAPGDRTLTDGERRDIAETVLDRVGLAPKDDNAACRWIAVRHADDHVHLAVTLAPQDGRKASTSNDFHKLGVVANEIEARYGLTMTAASDRTAGTTVSPAETEKADRNGQREPARQILRREVRTAAAGAATPDESFDRLKSAGVMVRPRMSDLNIGEVTGYAVAWPELTTADGKPVWFCPVSRFSRQA
jgi:hypothetical protein